jgi:thiol-disulfide isomerase/thioredoxin
MNPHCGHCVTLKPKFEAFSDRYPNITFAVIDTSKTPAIDLEGVPTMVVYKNGQNIDIIVGADERRLQQALDNLSGTQGTFNNSRIR